MKSIQYSWFINFWFSFWFALTLSVECSGVEKSGDVDGLSQQAIRIIEQHCVKCHNDRDAAGELSLTNQQAFRRGSQSGSLIDPSDSDASLLLGVITPQDGRAEMPQEAPPLSAEDREVIYQWIRHGAHWPDDMVLTPENHLDNNWWSLLPLSRPSVPKIVQTDAEQSLLGPLINPIDAFVLRKLNEKGWISTPPADKRTLARRLYLNLIGLPPTPEELDLFELDDAADAYERLVNRLLDSPRYGERWARHWLDVVQYADTHGYDKDQPRPNAWPYRDYVIRSFNEDKAWSRFIQEQIAGDILFPDTRDGVEALGLLSAGPWDLVGHAEVPESKIDGKIARHLDRDDMVRNTIQSFNSLTIGCAQCHNHKFDPIDQVEYYQLQAVFAALDRADKPYYIDRELALKKRFLDTQYSTCQAEIEQLLDVQSGAESEGSEELKSLQQSLAEIEERRSQLPPPDLVYAGTVYHGQGTFKGTGESGGRPREIRVLVRGEVTQPLQRVSPGGLALVSGLAPSFELNDEQNEGQRRAAVAEWLSSPNNSYTWRSIVNRVWQHHFGQGLVDTPNDFGQMGGQPSHPELLDWLACEFRDGRQSLKDLHRLIVTSRTWRQSSDNPEGGDQLAAQWNEDPNNRLLWRANRRKLDAEVIRDSILAIAGQLDLSMGGPGFREFVVEKPEHSPHYRYDLHDYQDTSAYRRTVYRFTVRSQMQPFLNALDCADPSQQVAKRNESQTPLQALTMLNNGLVLTMSQRFAEKLERAPSMQMSDCEQETLSRQVARGFLEITGSPPEDVERRLLANYALEHGLANACRVLFNLNEFLFVD